MVELRWNIWPYIFFNPVCNVSVHGICCPCGTIYFVDRHLAHRASPLVEDELQPVVPILGELAVRTYQRYAVTNGL